MIKLFLASFCMGGSLCMADALPAQTVEQHAYAEVNAEELKSWVDQGKQMVLVDCRSGSYDGRLLPNAIWIPYDAPDETIQQALPSKDTLIVVYCANPTCPVSRTMIDRLFDQGYTNVSKYPGGLNDWVQHGFPINKTSAS